MTTLKKRYLLPLSCATGFLLLSSCTAFANSVVNTKHNLSVSGTGAIHATSETRVCIFCHTPHHASDVTPLWSRPENTTQYQLYASTTMVAEPGKPTGYSRLCLSCHDGTIALGALHGAVTPIPFSGFQFIPSTRASYLGTDLRDDHPISFPYTAQLAIDNGELKRPADLPPAIKLEDDVNLECTSCHNPHSDPYGKFLVMDNQSSQLCTACHDRTGWSTSSHAAVSLAGVTGCLNCHDTHSAGGAQRLLKSADGKEETTCLNCHKPGVLAGAKDIQTELGKVSHHPVEATMGVHDPKEELPLPATAYHVECADCHNPHQLVKTTTTAVAPFINGNLKGVKGITIDGSVTSGNAQYEYEVCFRCHEENTFVTTNTIIRQIEEGNIRLCFDPVNPSFHPVAAPGKNNNVPSLRHEYDESSMIYCTDCHNSNNSAKAGGSGANGPHGSDYEPLLIANYETGAPPQTYSLQAYALCFRCHDNTVLLSGSSAFPKHSSHVVTQGIPCSVCHDPHGIPRSGGSDTANAHLINFDIRPNVVAPGGMYDSVARSCNVTCHGTSHATNPKTY